MRQKNQEKVLRDNAEAWERSFPSYKVIQMEEKFEKHKVEKIFLSEQPSDLFLYKRELTCTATLAEVSDLPLQVKKLLKEFGYVFSKEGPNGLPPFRGIEHQIDLVLEANIPNRLTYRINHEETKEIESQFRNFWKRVGFKRV